MKLPVLVNEQHYDASEVCHPKVPFLIAIVLRIAMSDTLFDLSQYQSQANISESARANASKINKTKWTKNFVCALNTKIRFFVNLIFLPVDER